MSPKFQDGRAGAERGFARLEDLQHDPVDGRVERNVVLVVGRALLQPVRDTVEPDELRPRIAEFGLAHGDGGERRLQPRSGGARLGHGALAGLRAHVALLGEALHARPLGLCEFQCRLGGAALALGDAECRPGGVEHGDGLLAGPQIVGRRVDRTHPGDDGRATLDWVARLDRDAGEPARDRGGDHVAVAHPRAAFLGDPHLQRAACHVPQIDERGPRPEGCRQQSAHDQRRSERQDAPADLSRRHAFTPASSAPPGYRPGRCRAAPAGRTPAARREPPARHSHDSQR